MNVALAVFSKDAMFLKFKNKTSTGRISALFPDFKARQFKQLIDLVKDRFQVIEKEFNSGLNLWARTESLNELLLETLPKDDSALVWSAVSNGVSSDMEIAFDKIYSRYITQFDHRSSSNGKSDEDVWRAFKRDLEQRNLLHYFERKKISSRDDEIEFSLAWKNGVWHCIEPISFDLSAQEKIRDKAHKYLGQLTSVSDSSERFKLYIVAAKPRDPSLVTAFERAMSILEKIPTDKQIFTEEQSSALADYLSAQIADDITEKGAFATEKARLHS